MSFKIPSANNSTNERRARRAKWKSNVRTGKTVIAELTAIAERMVEAGEVKANGTGYTVTPFSTFEITRAAEGFDCRCSDKRDLGVCTHVIAAELFAARAEAEKQARIAAARRLIAEVESETGEVPPRGFVNVTEKKVIAAIERVAGQEFSCEVRKTGTGEYRVHSFASGNAYAITLNRGIFGVTAHCGCPDFTSRRLPKDEVCKHISAVYHFERQAKVVCLNEFNVPSFAVAA